MQRMKLGIGGGIGPLRGGVSTRGVGAGCGPLSIGTGGGGCGTILVLILWVTAAFWVLAWPWELTHHLARHSSVLTASTLAWIAEGAYLVILLGLGVAVLAARDKRQP